MEITQIYERAQAETFAFIAMHIIWRNGCHAREYNDTQIRGRLHGGFNESVKRYESNEL